MSHPSSQTFTIRTGEEILPPGPVPVISTALFLKVLITVPSFRRRRGLLLLSATFCFSLERTFKLGSEAGERVAGLRIHLHRNLKPSPAGSRATLSSSSTALCPPRSHIPGSQNSRTRFTEGKVITAVIGPKQRQFVGGRRPRRAALGRGTLVQRSMVGSPGDGMEADLGYYLTLNDLPPDLPPRLASDLLCNPG